jgi:hypothetical protein
MNKNSKRLKEISTFPAHNPWLPASTVNGFSTTQFKLYLDVLSARTILFSRHINTGMT